jgi:PadR family transcriptional regulator PadR
MTDRPGADRQTQWLRGVLDLAVLATLQSAGTSYGYALIQSLTRSGVTDLKGGTIYPLLARLEQDGLVSNEWRAGGGGPGRKYFTITPPGMQELARSAAGWLEFSARMGAILSLNTIGAEQ